MAARTTAPHVLTVPPLNLALHGALMAEKSISSGLYVIVRHHGRQTVM